MEKIGNKLNNEYARGFVERARASEVEAKRKEAHDTRGFIVPNATQVPNELLDHMLPDLSGAELKVILYIIRKTFGYSKENTGDRVPMSQFLSGTTSKGKVIDRGTGLSKRALWKAIASLEEKGLIEIMRGKTDDGMRDINHYRLVVRDRY